MSNILRLRIVDKNNIDDDTQVVMIQNTSLEKTKPKRGRPRKNPNQSPPQPETTKPESIIVPKKRGRKRKIDKLNTDGQKKITENMVTISKNYIVQLKIKSSDLEKIQKQFINKSQKIGYDNVNQENLVTNGGHTHENYFVNNKDRSDEKYSFNEYYNLLNRLELPLIPVPHEISESILPKIQNMYQNIAVPILPENVPIKLFDANQSSDSQNSQIVGLHELSRNTGDIMLPLLDDNGLWPDKSPYACWNCDSFFSGTPWGVPDPKKEPVDGKFYCYGNFCSGECVARYLADREHTIDFWDKYSLLCLIYQRAYNLPPETKVPIAPPKETLSKYGGKLSYENYHNMTKQDYTVEIYKLPLIPVLLHIGEMYRSTNINNIIQNNSQKPQKPVNKPYKTKQVIPIDPLKMSKAEENIKQKTNVLLGSSYTLDNCLNLNKNKMISAKN